MKICALDMLSLWCVHCAKQLFALQMEMFSL